MRYFGDKRCDYNAMRLPSLVEKHGNYHSFMLQTRKLKIEVKWGQKNELVQDLFKNFYKIQIQKGSKQ